MYKLSVFVIAKYFLSQASMTHKKLQKLCYYGQAWHCALEGSPLFMERIEAWVHGPVIPDLYQKYKGYGWQKIPSVSMDESELPESALEVLKAVYDTYGEFSGDQLEALTHTEAPYQEARKGLNPYDTCTNEITPHSMSEYYLKQYQDAQND
ncbi:MAG: SocA family protein [Synergistaceae bacterium]|nr:SocA family protein [Synergistaceae bacterium]